MLHRNFERWRSDILSILKDLYYINKKSLTKTVYLLIKNWPIVFTGIVYSILGIIVTTILGLFMTNFILRFFTGIVSILAMSAIGSNYLHLMFKIVKHEKFTFQDFKDGFTVYLRELWTIFFVIWIVNMLLGMIIIPILGGLLRSVITSATLYIIIYLLGFILLNPLPETVYQKHYSSLDSFPYAFNFVKENWLEWFLPNIVFGAIMYFALGRIFTNILFMSFGFMSGLSFGEIFTSVLALGVLSFVMIYRGILFEILSTSTRRKRMFMRNMYK